MSAKKEKARRSQRATLTIGRLSIQLLVEDIPREAIERGITDTFHLLTYQIDRLEHKKSQLKDLAQDMGINIY